MLNENSRLLHETPKLMPIPFKPLLIDIGFEAAATYDISNLETGDSKQESSSGIMNMISGFWGSK